MDSLPTSRSEGTRMRRGFTLVILVGLLVACGSSGSSASGVEQKYIDAMMKSYDSSDAKQTLTRDQAQCISERFITTVGVDQLEAAKLSPADVAKDQNAFNAVGKTLTRAQAEQVAGVFTDGECVNFTDVALKQLNAGGTNPFKGVPDSNLRCMFDRLLAKPAFKDAMVEGILGSAGSDAAFTKAFGDQATLVSVMLKCKINPASLSAK